MQSEFLLRRSRDLAAISALTQLGHRTYVVVPCSLDQVNLLPESVNRMFAFQCSPSLVHRARARHTFELSRLVERNSHAVLEVSAARTKSKQLLTNLAADRRAAPSGAAPPRHILTPRVSNPQAASSHPDPA